MPCCGQQRRAIQSRTSAVMRSRSARSGLRVRAIFRYLGRTSLTARGPVSGRLYHFDRAHAIVEVDPRDAHSIARIPGLQQVVGNVRGG